MPLQKNFTPYWKTSCSLPVCVDGGGVLQRYLPQWTRWPLNIGGHAWVILGKSPMKTGLWLGQVDAWNSKEIIVEGWYLLEHIIFDTYHISSYSFHPWTVSVHSCTVTFGRMLCDLWILKFKKQDFPRKLYKEIRYVLINKTPHDIEVKNIQTITSAPLNSTTEVTLT